MLSQLLIQFETLATGALGSTSALDRMRGIKGTFSRNGSGTIWVILVLGLLTVGGIIIGYTISQKRQQVRARWRNFWNRAAEAGLGDEEGSLLRNLAIAAKLVNPVNIFASADAFYRGLSVLENSTADVSLFGQAKTTACSSCRFFRSLQEKLGFTGALQDTPSSDQPSLGPIRPGTMLGISREKEPQEFEVKLITDGESRGQVAVSWPQDMDVEIGEVWRLRYPEGGILWEFDARVVRLADQCISLQHTGHVRYMDRRRFLRVPARRPARVALFPFERLEAGAAPPRFFPAQLMELGGPGVVLEAEMQVERGDRVLVVIDLDDRSIESLGVVRRGSRPGDQASVIAIELLALSTSQIAELARETNSFAVQANAGKLEEAAELTAASREN